jgi:hypothetical protein
VKGFTLGALHYQTRIVLPFYSNLSSITHSPTPPIYTLCQYIPAREWVWVECELEKCDYLLRDRIGDLLSKETWEND